MAADNRLVSTRFPRATQYHPDWVLANASGGANALWIVEWLTSALDLRPGMRVLDLGCGRASTSIFLRREFGVQVWATDLWFSAAENIQRVRDAGVDDGVFPVHADARALPFAPDFFDAIVCVDAFPVLRDRRPLPELPRPLRQAWRAHRRSPAPASCRSSMASCRITFARGGARTSGRFTPPPGGAATGSGPASSTSRWPTPCRTAARCGWTGRGRPRRTTRSKSPRSRPMRGRYLGYVRLVGRRRGDARLEEYCWPDTMRSLPVSYAKHPLLRNQE